GRLAVEERLMALAEATNLLREGGSIDASLRRIIERAIAPYDAEPSRFSLAGDDVPLSSQAALAIAMAFHELCTNATKHGSLSAKEGRVDVAWSNGGAKLALRWQERGGPPVRAPTRRGFGTRVIEASFRDQLRGTVELAFAPSGLVCATEVPFVSLRDQRR